MAKEFINGMIAKKPSDKAPDFIKAKLSFKVEEFKAYLDENSNDGWVNIEVKESKKGSYYAELDSWKKDSKTTDQDPF